jgi:Fe-S cluster assembly ATP-binding protein
MKELKSQMKTSGLIITHTGHILDYVNADRAQVMFDGRLCCEGRPRDILDHISKYGYKECVRCLK